MRALTGLPRAVRSPFMPIVPLVASLAFHGVVFAAGTVVLGGGSNTRARELGNEPSYATEEAVDVEAEPVPVPLIEPSVHREIAPATPALPVASHAARGKKLAPLRAGAPAAQERADESAPVPATAPTTASADAPGTALALGQGSSDALAAALPASPAGAASGNPNAIPRYLQDMRTRLVAAMTFPDGTRAEGSIVLRIVLESDGAIRSVDVEGDDGALREAALRGARRSSPFPPLPREFGNETTHAFRVPLRFSRAVGR